jgi:2,5-dihydroxypyridine 5,6-dioxygenase
MLSVTPSTFADLCEKELQLCGLKEGEVMAVLTQGGEKLDYADAFLTAADRLGATGFHVRVPNAAASLSGDAGQWAVGATPLATNQPALEALKAADLVIDTIFLLFSKEQLEIQDAGARILLCIEPIEHLVQLFPTTEQRERVEYGGELLGKAKTLRFTNALGTDVTYQLGTYPVITEYGYTDTPGRWDHWPSGFLFTGGADDGVDGKVVLAPGDIVYPFKEYVRTPVEFTIEQGRIVDIRGQLDADIVRDYMASFNDEKAYGIAHIGWGLNEKATWSYLATDRRGLHMHGRCFYGNVLFSTGPNQEFGGTNDTQCHVDMPMRNCSLYLDDEPIVVDGDIVVDQMKARRPVPVGAS